MTSKPTEPQSYALEIAIGLRLLAFRQTKKIKLAELATMTGLSVSMLSKIENGKISASLATLQHLSNALSVPIPAFFENHDTKKRVVFTKAGESVGARPSDPQLAPQLRRLGRISRHATGVSADPRVIELHKGTDLYMSPPQKGLVTVFMLEGAMEHRHADDVYSLEKGDTLFFRTSYAHGPTSITTGPASFLSVLSVA